MNRLIEINESVNILEIIEIIEPLLCIHHYLGDF